MLRCKQTNVMLCGLAIVSAALTACVGCGTKEEPKAPSGSGYYTGDMKSKSVKGQSDTAPANQAPAGAQ